MCIRVDPNQWILAGAGDFSRDGKSDLVNHNKNNGSVDIWNNGNASSSLHLGGASMTDGFEIKLT